MLMLALRRCLAVSCAAREAGTVPEPRSSPLCAARPSAYRARMVEEAKDMIRNRTQHIALVQDSKGLGTGVVVGPDGWILTNRHVAPSVGPFRVILANGRNVHGVGVHQSSHHDLAIVKVGAETPEFFDVEVDVAEDFTVGEEVWAIGHPRGCRFSVARGIIS